MKTATLKYNPPATYTKDEQKIWSVLIYNDFVAFCSENWSLIANDFIEDGFFGIDGKQSTNKSDWTLTYPNLAAYKKDWIKQSKEFNSKNYQTDPLEVLFTTTKLTKIEIINDTALVHKSFNGEFLDEHNEVTKLNWLSLFILRKVDSDWKIANFTGYLPK